MIVGIGCHYGKHRSVAMVERIAEELKEKGLKAQVFHRDISKDEREKQGKEGSQKRQAEGFMGRGLNCCCNCSSAFKRLQLLIVCVWAPSDAATEC